MWRHQTQKFKGVGSAGLLLWLLDAVFASRAGAVVSPCCSPGVFVLYVNQSEGTYTSTRPFRAPCVAQFVKHNPLSWKPTSEAAAVLNKSWYAEAVLLDTVFPVS